MKKLLAMVLTLAMLAGCMSVAMAWEPQAKLDEDLSAYKLCENFGDIKLSVAVTDHASIATWEDNAFIKWVEEVTNVDLEFVLIPYESRAEKLGLVLSSGDYPDIFLSCGMTSAMVSRFGVGEGLFLPLNDLIETKGNFINKIFEEYPGSKGLITELDGNIYALPVVNECYHCTIPTKFWINQTWLDNLGLKMPTTLEELHNVLVAFKEQDANGNGDASDEIPLAGDYQDGWYTNVEMPIMSAFTFYNLDLDTTNTTNPEAFGMYLEDGTVVTPFALDAFKKGVETVAQWVKEGLIYEGSFTQDLAGLTQIAESGRLGASSGGYILFANLGGDAYRQFRPVLPVKGPDGFASIQSFPHDSVGGKTFVISADCKNPEAAFMIGDLMYSYAATMRGYYGIYGEQWTDAQEGEVGINGEPALYHLLVPWQESEPQSYCILQMTTSFRDAAYRLGEPSDPNVDLYSGAGLETLLYQVTHEYEPFKDDAKIIPPIKFTDDENEEMSLLKANLSNTIKENMIAFFNGTKTVENDYDAFLAELEAQGLNRLVEMYQNSYNAQYK